jgi:hypothetical protein
MTRKKLLDEIFDIEQVVAAMEQYCPRPKRSTGKSYQKIAETYKLMVLSHAQLKQRDPMQIKMGLYNLALDKIRESLGRYSLGDKKQLWWREWFDRQPFSLYTVMTKGSNMTEKNTMVKLNFDLASAGEIAHWTRELIEANFPVGDVDGYWYTNIDSTSLTAYIKSTQAALKAGNYDTKSEEFTPLNRYQRATYQENLKIATAIEVLTEAGRLRQAVKQSPFGRLYFKGINLQNCHTTVRHAALGDCHSYDLVSASQAWRMHECQKIQPDSYPYTSELLSNRNLFRRRVAHIMGTQNMDLAKQVLTAIGFGADITDSAWPSGDSYKLPALRDILTDEQLTRLTLSPWFMGFVAEQQLMNAVIFKHFKQVFPKTDYPACILDKGKKLVKNKALAWLYQNAESTILTTLVDYIKQHCAEDNILLIVHDAVYLRMSIDVSGMQGLLLQLNPYLKIEHTKHTGYTYQDIFGILDHRLAIKTEETQALRYQLAKMEQAKWDDAEYKSSHKLFARERDGILDKSAWDEFEQAEYQRLHDLYYMTWFKDIIMGNKNWRATEDYQRFISKASNTEFSDGSEGCDGYYD